MTLRLSSSFAVFQAQLLQVFKGPAIAPGQSLEDFLGKSEAKVAQQMIDAADEKITKEVQGRIHKARGLFESLDVEEQNQKRKDGELEVHWKKVVSSKTVGCPACSAQALLNGNEVSESEPRLEGDEVVIESVLLPSKFECYTCGLEIEGYGKLKLRVLVANIPVNSERTRRSTMPTGRSLMAGTPMAMIDKFKQISSGMLNLSRL